MMAPGHEALAQMASNSFSLSKDEEFYFRYKLHNKVDVCDGLIGAIETTTASVHDTHVDLSVDAEPVYRDKGYFGTPAKGCTITICLGTRGHPLNRWDKLRNLQISRITKLLNKAGKFQ
jgi:transposase, IS5 family